MLSGLMSLCTPSAAMQGPRVLGGAPMNKAELVDCFDRKHALGHVEPRDILRESVILDEHGHQVAAR